MADKSMTWENLKEEIHAEGKFYDDEAPFSGEADYYYGVRDGLNKALVLIEDYEKESR